MILFRISDFISHLELYKMILKLPGDVLEFGVYKGELLLGDEFTPDGCRVWDSETREKLDKDRFRQDLGEVVESYKIIAKKLGIN